MQLKKTLKKFGASSGLISKLLFFLLLAFPVLYILSKITKGMNTIEKYFIPLIEKFEGYTPFPFWDYKQWSWGYGTFAGADRNKKPEGNITKDKAKAEALVFMNTHYQQLKPLVKVDLKPNQWAALLSFSYNLGVGNAKNLLRNINAKNTSALEIQWNKYVIAGGKVLQGLVKRRKAEFAIWKM